MSPPAQGGVPAPVPGDIIFTGTPSGVGMVQKPPRSLQTGQVEETWIEGIGSIRNHCVKAEA
jgi:2,4-didehydro-3-deoxy-L-rhamnonate hydrolase